MYKRQHSEKYTTNQDMHTYNTRNKNKVVTIAHTSTNLEKSPYYKTAVLQNLMKNIKNDTLFTKLLKKNYRFLRNIIMFQTILIIF
jgi:uncharacterized membrane protein